MMSIELVDGQGVPRLRIDPPEGKDATGKRLAAGERLTLAVAGNRVTLRMNAAGMSYPLAIDPSWSSTGAMAVPRQSFSSSLLANGNVLVAGGNDKSNTWISSEIYNPTTGVWSPANNMTISRSGHRAVTLADGKVLVSGK